MKVRVNSINHLRRLKTPPIIYLILLLALFMALNLVINRTMVVTVNKEVFINDHEFVLEDKVINIKTSTEEELIITKVNYDHGIYQYRIQNNLEGLTLIKYEIKINLFKLIKIV